MALGTGIAIAGVWIFAGLFSHSTSTTGDGVVTAVVLSIIMTIILLIFG